MASHFNVTGYSIIGEFIGGKPYGIARDWASGFGVTGDTPPVTLGVHVDVMYGPPEPYTKLKLRLDYPAAVGSKPEVPFDPTDGYIVWSLQPGYPRDFPGPTMDVDLLGVTSGGDVKIDSTSLLWLPVCRSCANIPTFGGAGGGGCSSGDCVHTAAPDRDGFTKISYGFAGSSDPLGMAANLIWNSNDGSWGFAALPGDLSVDNLGDTGEPTPRECWQATVPAADGTSRVYCNDSSTGEFVPCGSYGTTFASTSSGWKETIGDAEVHYDVYGVLSKVVRGQSVHTYTWDSGGAYVDIEANTSPPTKFRYSLSGGVVQSVHQYAKLSGSTWTECRLLSVSQSGGQISQLTSYPGGRTTGFSYNTDGTLASYEDCSGRTWSMQYETV